VVVLVLAAFLIHPALAYRHFALPFGRLGPMQRLGCLAIQLAIALADQMFLASGHSHIGPPGKETDGKAESSFTGRGLFFQSKADQEKIINPSAWAQDLGRVSWRDGAATD
jgi:hypothetical protein